MVGWSIFREDHGLLSRRKQGSAPVACGCRRNALWPLWVPLLLCYSGTRTKFRALCFSIRFVFQTSASTIEVFHDNESQARWKVVSWVFGMLFGSGLFARQVSLETYSRAVHFIFLHLLVAACRRSFFCARWTLVWVYFTRNSNETRNKGKRKNGWQKRGDNWTSPMKIYIYISTFVCCHIITALGLGAALQFLTHKKWIPSDTNHIKLFFSLSPFSLPLNRGLSAFKASMLSVLDTSKHGDGEVYRDRIFLFHDQSKFQLRYIYYKVG